LLCAGECEHYRIHFGKGNLIHRRREQTDNQFKRLQGANFGKGYRKRFKLLPQPPATTPARSFPLPTPSTCSQRPLASPSIRQHSLFHPSKRGQSTSLSLQPMGSRAQLRSALLVCLPMRPVASPRQLWHFREETQTPQCSPFPSVRQRFCAATPVPCSQGRHSRSHYAFSAGESGAASCSCLCC